MCTCFVHGSWSLTVFNQSKIDVAFDGTGICEWLFFYFYFVPMQAKPKWQQQQQQNDDKHETQSTQHDRHNYNELANEWIVVKSCTKTKKYQFISID